MYIPALPLIVNRDISKAYMMGQPILGLLTTAHTSTIPISSETLLNVLSSPSTATVVGVIRDSVDSLCRDSEDMPKPLYKGKACNRPNAAFVSLFRHMTAVCEHFCI